MIELIQTIAGFFTMAVQSIGNALAAIASLLPFANDIVGFMPTFFVPLLAIIVAFGLVKFVLSLF